MKPREDRQQTKTPLVVVSLPFAYREGVDEYNGIMRYLSEAGRKWDMRLIRHSFSAALFDDFPIDEVSGVVCGMDFRPGIASYEPRIPDDALELLSRHDIPVVGIDMPDVPRLHGNASRRAFVSIDSERIGRKAAQYLGEADGYASFGFVGAFTDCAWSRDRGAFFVRELRRLRRRNVSIFQGDALRGNDELLPWLESLPKPAAVFASNDHCADIVLRTCAQGGVRVPEDMAVLGVDDDPIFCIHTMPSLSSLHPDFELEGYFAAQALDMFLSGKRPRARMVVGGDMAVTARMSTAPCSPAGRLVRRADEIIATRACMGLTADVLAGALGISRRLLDLRYRQINGKTVRTAIEDTRLSLARRLLSGTRLSHGEIARSCGYKSESYLEHVFIRRFGRSMSDFRRSGAREDNFSDKNKQGEDDGK